MESTSSRIRWSLLILWAMTLLLAGCSSTGGLFDPPPPSRQMSSSARNVRDATPVPVDLPRELSKQLEALYVVEPGDVILVQPVKFDSPVRLPGDQSVLADGTISLGEHGLIHVAGRTIPDIEALIQSRVEARCKDAGPITVRLISRDSKVFYVLGEVNAPGAFPATGRETVLDAILNAGGLTDQASTDNVILVRPSLPGECRTVLAVCYNDIVQLGDTSTNYQIRPGDRVFVSASCFWDNFLPFGSKKSCCNQAQLPCITGCQ